MTPKNQRIVLILAAVAIAGYGGYRFLDNEPTPRSGPPIVDVKVPSTLASVETEGRALFDANCATCHGANAAGQDGVAPPLVHLIYEPNHHGDESFQLAVSQGVRQHHWPFGNMAPVEGLERGDVERIVAYVRALQRENGIF